VNGYGIQAQIIYYSSGPNIGKWDIVVSFSQTFYPFGCTAFQLGKTTAPICSGSNIVVDVDLPYNISSPQNFPSCSPIGGFPGTIHITLA
jgi:hypothetical protein